MRLILQTTIFDLNKEGDDMKRTYWEERLNGLLDEKQTVESQLLQAKRRLDEVDSGIVLCKQQIGGKQTNGK